MRSAVVRAASRYLLAGLVSLSCCGGSERTLPTLAPSSLNQEADLGLEELRKSLESTVLENYVQLTFGNIEAFLDGVATEREVQFIGVTPRDVVVGVNPAALQKDRRLYRHRRPHILSKNLDVHLSEDGSVGWVYDEVSYRIEYMGREASVPIRSTALYVRDVERWVLVSEHLSYGVPMSDLVALVARGDFKAGTIMKTENGPSEALSASLVGLVGRFVNGSSSDEVVFDDEDTLILLPGPEQEFHGFESLDAPALAEIFGTASTVAVQTFRVQLSLSKRVAWMVANLSVRSEFNGDEFEIPLRGSFVLERRRDKGWGLVQAHVSAPLSEKELSARVFGPTE